LTFEATRGKTSPTVVTIDDHDVVHAGIEAWCEKADPPVYVLGAFHDPGEFVEAFADREREIDVVVLELRSRGKLDFDALRALCERGLRVIVFSDVTADEIVLTCLDIGAATYLVKSEGQRHLIEAIREVSAATPYVGPRMAKAVNNDCTLGRIKLSDREREVLVAWFQTESKEAVGKRLFIAPTTVRTHLQRARAKYASVGRPAPTKSALLARAIEDGLLALTDL
jgi:DNA-binding NarL/FixJ family response regulator